SDDGLEDSDLSQRIKIPKLWKDLWKVNALGEEEAEVILEKNKINQNIPMLLRRMKSGMVDRGDLVTPIAEVIFAGHCLADNGTEFRDHVEYLSRASSLFEQTDCARGTVELLLDHRSWIRQLNDWRPRSYNPEKQFRSLAQHLLAKFEVPMFMDQAWTKANQTHQEWFKHVAGGKNISTARGFPKSMTKRAAHFFMQAPPQYSITDAIRYGQILSLGGDRRLCDVVIETRLGQTLEHDDFWLTVLRFFVRNPMLDPLWIGPIIDYIHYRRFEPILEAGEDGLLEERPPLQPDFSISGRSVAALLRMVQVWHGELANAEDSELRWAPSGISGFNLEANSEADLFDILRRPTQAGEPIDINNHWRIRELLSSAELIAEGKNLRHCVASYARSCHQGQCSIWTLELQSELFRERRVTIEVNPKTRHIRQVRGLKNRYATDEEKRVIKLWSVREDLIY
ncbi:MAG: PcfJ domain-containing protein, partial [Cyanobacteria bacterium]|nr:PcfJ domain-containing protein [Cyanobacteriota bacterium]